MQQCQSPPRRPPSSRRGQRAQAPPPPAPARPPSRPPKSGARGGRERSVVSGKYVQPHSEVVSCCRRRPPARPAPGCSSGFVSVRGPGRRKRRRSIVSSGCSGDVEPAAAPAASSAACGTACPILLQTRACCYALCSGTPTGKDPGPGCMQHWSQQHRHGWRRRPASAAAGCRCRLGSASCD